MNDPIDEHVGSQIRVARTVQGKSQTDVANCLGISFQQVRKYENGFNRISASSLYKVAGYLSVRPEFFFEGLEEQEVEPSQKVYTNALKIVGALSLVKDRQVRQHLGDLIDEFAG